MTYFSCYFRNNHAPLLAIHFKSFVMNKVRLPLFCVIFMLFGAVDLAAQGKRPFKKKPAKEVVGPPKPPEKKRQKRHQTLWKSHH